MPSIQASRQVAVNDALGRIEGAAPHGPVLVVDDDADIRDVIAATIQIEGYDVVSAQNGAVALDLLRRGDGVRPCVILLDLMMPVMNGWDFYAELKEDEALSTIPVVVLSGAADVAGKAAELGVAGGVGKPISAENLLAIIKPFC